ncbi:mavicyanin-like [Dioscorea cayenensis subsp. rotundata]|uniref:Mavicyanin-like n=1 Tax=Dioscorea cayennensis subsp. rotundata TaxID=55577 RepID=A0AB40CM39_DIOCR|nr:mavicyanin-like [Dioscorea cayenensis subsp. rotundata]
MAPSLSMLVLFLFLGLGSSMGEVYKVGDSAGWTILGNVNYTAWASSKKFKVGDVLMFEYDSQFHNVLEVSKDDYHACNNGSPLTTYSTGNDSITIKRRGHHFFLCGFPGHCAAGQKLDVRIPKLRSSGATASSPAAAASSPASSLVVPSVPPPSPSIGTSSPSPRPNSAIPAFTNFSSRVTLIVTFVVAMFYVFTC